MSGRRRIVDLADVDVLVAREREQDRAFHPGVHDPVVADRLADAQHPVIERVQDVLDDLAGLFLDRGRVVGEPLLELCELRFQALHRLWASAPQTGLPSWGNEVGRGGRRPPTAIRNSSQETT